MRRAYLLSLCCLVVAVCSVSNPAFAWCFGNGCVTDDSVCDMGLNTINQIDTKTFVWARAPRKVEIYTRLAAREVLDHCTNGQELFLHTDGRTQWLDQPVLTDVAKSFCRVADIVKTAVPGREPGTSGFEIKCMISKMEQARADFEQRERKISTAKMLEEDNRTPEGPGTSGPQKGLADVKPAPPECGKWTLGSLFGLSGPCAGK